MRSLIDRPGRLPIPTWPILPSSPPRPRGRKRAVAFTEANAASRFQRRFSAAPALFV